MKTKSRSSLAAHRARPLAKLLLSVGALAGLAAGMTVIGWPEPHRSDIVFPDRVIVADPHDLTSTLGQVLANSPDHRHTKDPADVSR